MGVTPKGEGGGRRASGMTFTFHFSAPGGQNCTRRFWGRGAEDAKKAAQAWADANGWRLV